MGVFLYICCILSKHLLLRTPLVGCFWRWLFLQKTLSTDIFQSSKCSTVATDLISDSPFACNVAFYEAQRSTEIFDGISKNNPKVIYLNSAWEILPFSRTKEPSFCNFTKWGNLSCFASLVVFSSTIYDNKCFVTAIKI